MQEGASKARSSETKSSETKSSEAKSSEASGSNDSHLEAGCDANDAPLWTVGGDGYPRHSMAW